MRDRVTDIKYIELWLAREVFTRTETRKEKLTCGECRADYEGDEPRNCKIFCNTGSCKFIDNALLEAQTAINKVPRQERHKLKLL